MRSDAPLLFVDSLVSALSVKRDHDMIEPYRVDGTIVGDGSQDFTKTYTSSMHYR